MKKRMWPIRVFSIIFCISISVSSGCYYIFHQNASAESEKIEKPTVAKKTNTSPALFTIEEIYKKIRLFPDAYFSSLAYYEASDDYGTYVIPGLKATYTLKNGKKDMCTTMTPQGICIAGDYILVSAYCHNHTHNSVIYVINKNDGSYVKEIILPGKPHVGGIIYEPTKKEIWVTSKMNMIPQLCVFTLDQLEDYNAKSNKTIKYKYRYSIPTLSNASFMAYYDNHIYVGSFAYKKKECKMQRFSLVKTKNAKESKSGRYFILDKTYTIQDIVQGVGSYKNQIFFSRSDGPYKNSKIDVFDVSVNDEEISDFTQAETKYSFNFPERMEQIYFDGDECYILFESASNGYNQVGLTFIDRIIVVNMNSLLSQS